MAGQGFIRKILVEGGDIGYCTQSMQKFYVWAIHHLHTFYITVTLEILF